MSYRAISRFSWAGLAKRMVLAMAFVCLASLVNAQINTGRIDGAVRDVSGAVVPEARVSVTNDATGAVTSAQSSAAGDYVVNFLAPGTYHVMYWWKSRVSSAM